MRTYRDYLNERKVPKGPWCVLELHNVKESSNVPNRPNERGKAIALSTD